MAATELPLELRALSKPLVAYTRSVSSSDSGSNSPNNLSSSNLCTKNRISSLPFQLNSPLLSSSPSPSASNGNGSPTKTDEELLLQNLSKLSLEFQDLNHNLNKFNNKSSISVNKTNLLRLTLLKFLRLQNDLKYLNSNILLKFINKNFNSPILYSKLLNFIKLNTNILSSWWNSLLDDLSLHWNKFTNIDRSVYLEAMSRIISRTEWSFMKLIDKNYEIYQNNLIDTLDLCFNRAFLMKTMSLPINAFIGKVFAYSFINIPEFGKILLFLLFVKNFTINNFIKNLQIKRFTKFKLIDSSLSCYVGDFNNLKNTSNNTSNNLNCMIPPKTIKFNHLNINMKDQNWTKKWANFDSDIFCSFLKHYYNIIIENSILDFNFNKRNEFDESIEVNKSTNYILNFPGFIIIHCHLTELFNSNVQYLKKFKFQSNHQNSKELKQQKFNPNLNLNLINYSHKNYLNFFHKLPIIKIFNIFRNLIFELIFKNNLNKYSIASFIKLLESIFIDKAKQTNAYNLETCEILYDFFLEFLIYLENGENLFLKDLNWEFWITGILTMLKTGHMINQAKAVSILFNIWDLIPRDCFNTNKENIFWISFPSYSLIFNLSNYLLSNDIWKQLFIHWYPLVRHFYYRLIIFKIINNSNNFMENYSFYLKFKVLLKSQLVKTFKIFNLKINIDELSLLKKYDLLPSNPILNKKLILSTMNSNLNLLDSNNAFEINIPDSPDSSSSSIITTTPLRSINDQKIYSFDIFDEAIYSASSISPKAPTLVGNKINRNSSSSSTLNRSNSILSSAINFFKKANHSQPVIKISTSSDSSSSSPVNTANFFKPAGFLSPNNNNHLLSTPKSMSSTSSSMSETLSETSDDEHNLIYRKVRGSRISSFTSLSSVNSLTEEMGDSASVSTMSSLPSPPELQVKIPNTKKFKYKFQLLYSNDCNSVQAEVLKRKHGFVNRDYNIVISEPILPFEKSNSIYFNNEMYDCYESDAESEESEESELIITPRKSVELHKQQDFNIEFFDLKNYLVLGKSLNEWGNVVREYEQFIQITKETGNGANDIMLVGSIPTYNKL